MDYPDPATTPLGEHFELSTHLIAREVIRRGYEPQWLRPAAFVVRVDGRMLGWNMTRCAITSTVGAEIAGRKDYTRQLLAQHGVATAPGGSYRPGEHDRALARAERVGWPVIVKPVDGRKGNGVSMATGPDEFTTAWQAAASGAKVVVEQRITGDEARFLVVAGRCVAVAGRLPAHVIGDGASTTAELVAAKTTARAANAHLAAHPLPEPANPGRVPAAGERVILDHRGGYSTGADSIDLTDEVHPSYLDVATAAYRALPGLGLAGVDIIATDWTQPADRGNHAVIEVNSRPAIGAHHLPWEGKPRDVAAAIVDACGVPRRDPDDNDPNW